MPRRVIRALRVILLGGLAVLTAMFAYSVWLRLRFPYELEWMTGSILDHVERVRAGLPIYTAPTLRWIPFLYTPLYYWVAAWVSPTFLGCRAVSLCAALAQAGCVYRLARRAAGAQFWGVVAAGLFFACFAYTGDWYDLERPDTLCMALVLVAVVVLTESRRQRASLAGGLLLGLAFFAKQQASVFVVGTIAALLLERRWKNALVFGAAALGLIVAGTAILDARTGGWFAFYVFKMPAKHGLLLGLLSDVLDYDVRYGVVLLLATLAFVADALLRRREDLLLAILLLAGGAGALSSRLHIGGWINVLQVWTGLACVAVAVVAARAEAWLATRGPRGRAVGVIALYAAILAQLASWLHDPREARRLGDGRPWGEAAADEPGPALVADTERFLTVVRRLEARGEVLVVGRGHVTTERHFQMAALADVIPMGGPPADLLDALAGRRLAAIVDETRRGGPSDPLWPPCMLEDIPPLRAALYAHYFVAERLPDAIVRIPMPAPASPRWVYLPRKRPLRGATDAELEARHLEEARLAEERSVALDRGSPEPFPQDQIEELADRDPRKSP